jgi:hypothetical protein
LYLTRKARLGANPATRHNGWKVVIYMVAVEMGDEQCFDRSIWDACVHKLTHDSGAAVDHVGRPIYYDGL